MIKAIYNSNCLSQVGIGCQVAAPDMLFDQTAGWPCNSWWMSLDPQHMCLHQLKHRNKKIICSYNVIKQDFVKKEKKEKKEMFLALCFDLSCFLSQVLETFNIILFGAFQPET